MPSYLLHSLKAHRSFLNFIQIFIIIFLILADAQDVTIPLSDAYYTAILTLTDENQIEINKNSPIRVVYTGDFHNLSFIFRFFPLRWMTRFIFLYFLLFFSSFFFFIFLLLFVDYFLSSGVASPPWSTVHDPWSVVSGSN